LNAQGCKIPTMTTKEDLLEDMAQSSDFGVPVDSDLLSDTTCRGSDECLSQLFNKAGGGGSKGKKNESTNLSPPLPHTSRRHTYCSMCDGHSRRMTAGKRHAGRAPKIVGVFVYTIAGNRMSTLSTRTSGKRDEGPTTVPNWVQT
jgi:hypothetical protein